MDVLSNPTHVLHRHACIKHTVRKGIIMGLSKVDWALAAALGADADMRQDCLQELFEATSRELDVSYMEVPEFEDDGVVVRWTELWPIQGHPYMVQKVAAQSENEEVNERAYFLCDPSGEVVL